MFRTEVVNERYACVFILLRKIEHSLPQRRSYMYFYVENVMIPLRKCQRAIVVWIKFEIRLTECCNAFETNANPMANYDISHRGRHKETNRQTETDRETDRQIKVLPKPSADGSLYIIIETTFYPQPCYATRVPTQRPGFNLQSDLWPDRVLVD